MDTRVLRNSVKSSLKRTCWLCERGGHQQNLCTTVAGEALVQMREPEIVACGQAQPAGGGIAGHQLHDAQHSSAWQ